MDRQSIVELENERRTIEEELTQLEASYDQDVNEMEREIQDLVQVFFGNFRDNFRNNETNDLSQSLATTHHRISCLFSMHTKVTKMEGTFEVAEKLKKCTQPYQKHQSEEY